MFNNTYARTTIYDLPVFPIAHNLIVLGDNKRILAEVATDFIFSFYKLMKNVTVFDAHNLFKNLANDKKIFVTNNADFMNLYLEYLIKNKANQDFYLIILNAQMLKQELVVKLLKQNNTFVNVILFYNNSVKELQDIAFNTQEVIFFKTFNKNFLNLAEKFCLECEYLLPFLLRKMKGFVTCNMQTRVCKYNKANLGLKTHLIYNEITEILEILLKEKTKKFYITNK